MRVFDIILKDLKVMLKDKKTIGIMVIMPIIITTILGGALGGAFVQSENNHKIQIAVVKQYDVKAEKEGFINNLMNNQNLQGTGNFDMDEMEKGLEEFNIEKIIFDEFLESDEIKKIMEYQILDMKEAKEQLKNDKLSAIVIFPEEFTFNMYTNFFTPYRNNIDIEIIGDPDRYIDNQYVTGIFRGFSDSVSTMIIGKNVLFETAMENGIGIEIFEKTEEIIEDMSGIIESLNIKLKTEKVNEKEPLSGFQYYTIAMTAMFILFTAGEGGKLLLEEKDKLTYQRMTMAGVSKSKIALGKFFTIFTFALIQIGIMIAYSSLALKVDWGNPITVGIITLCVVFSIAGLGTMLAAISFKSGNYKMADVFQSIFVFMLSALGGSFLPIDMMPEFIQKLSNYIPNGAALKAYNKAMLGSGLEDIFSFLIILVVLGVVFTTIAIYFLNRKEGWKNA